jgi:hypothetical protein
MNCRECNRLLDRIEDCFEENNPCEVKTYAKTLIEHLDNKYHPCAGCF